MPILHNDESVQPLPSPTPPACAATDCPLSDLVAVAAAAYLASFVATAISIPWV